MSSSQDLSLYFHEESYYSRKVIMALHEKGAAFDLKRVDLLAGENFQKWYLDVNPRGEVPTLVHGSKTVSDSTPIVRYVDANIGRPGQLFPQSNKAEVEGLLGKIDAVRVYELTFGVVGFQKEGIVKELRFPMNNPQLQQGFKHGAIGRVDNMKKSAEANKGTKAETELAAKVKSAEAAVALFTDRKLYLEFLSEQEKVFGELESQLESSGGKWLTGSAFTAADVALGNLMFRMWQVGLDDVFWKGESRRPRLEAYQAEVFERECFVKATGWKEHKDKVFKVADVKQ